MATVHIIGAGISGLSAATMLAEKHVPVKLYEATSHAGGRCRSSRESVFGSIDHGLHLVSGADEQLRHYLARIGQQESLTRATPLPLPTAPIIDYLPVLRWIMKPRGKADDSLARDSVLRDAWFRPLSKLIYGTPSEQLPARAFRQYLRRRSTRISSHSLQATYVQPALDYLEHCGGSIYFGHALTRIDRAGDTLKSLIFARKRVELAPGDIVILATPPSLVQTILPHLPVPAQNQSTITLHYACAHREPVTSITYPTDAPMDLLRYGADTIAATLRLATFAWHSDPALLAHRVWRAIQQHHSYLRETPMPHYAVWREKRAGHAVSEAPNVPHDHGSLLLAGDWLAPSRPATLEQAARSGHEAARLAMTRLRHDAPRNQQHFYLN